ncbi:PKD domain-containing protein [Archangium gephyra]|uniref:PKD domain-containing protein n=1 Tax=Archangium gephyra TaxID=48 RepID=UPI0035D48D41
MRRWAAWSAAAVLAAALVVFLVTRAPSGERHEETPAATRAPAAAPVPADVRHRPAPPTVTPGATARGALDLASIAAALDEELVPLASNIRILQLEADEVRLCAGRPVWLRARFEGATEPVVGRFLWTTPNGLALEPGTAARWTPDAPGSHEVRFQVVRSLERKRVALLAERTLTLQVEACDDKQQPLEVKVNQDRERVQLIALASVETVGGFAWDFGDGTTELTDAPRVRHEYPVLELGPGEVRSYRVVVEAHARDGASLRTTTNITVRGLPKPPAPEPVTLELGEAVWDDGAGRWRRTLEVHNRSPDAIVWETAERRSHWDDGRVETRTLAVTELVAIDSRKELGGFAGQVSVAASELAPGVRAVVDTLRGRNSEGAPIVLTWAAYEREDVAPKSPLPPARTR